MSGIQKLALDSRLAGANVGKIEVRNQGDFKTSSLKKFDLVFASGKLDLKALAAYNAFDWRFAGVKIVLQSPLRKINFEKIDLSPADFFKPGDKHDLLGLAEELFKHSRFYLDPCTHRLGKEIYRTWINNSMSGEAADGVLVHRDAKGKAIGFITIKKTGNYFEPVLVMVSGRHQGRGHGRLLMQKFLSYVLSMDKKARIVIHAMLENSAALRFYGSFGFKAAGCQFIYHIYPKGFRNF